MGGRLCSWRDITRTYKWGRESLLWRQDEVQMTLATSLEEALIGFCLLGAPTPCTEEELTLQREGWRLGSRFMG